MKILSIILLVLASFVAVVAQDNKLSPAQVDQLKKLKADVEIRTVPVALGLAETTKKIYANMLTDKEDEKLRKKLAKDLHRYAGQLLDIKGQSFRDALNILTPEQKHLLKAEMKKPDAPADLGELIERVFGLAAK